MTERKQQGGGGPLKTDRGSTTISNSVVSSIASVAMQEVAGAEPSGAPSAGSVLGGLTGGSGGNSSRGVSVEVGEEQAAVDLTVTVPYGRSIPETTKNIRDTVIKRVESLTGLEVTEVNITVRDVFIPEQ